MTEGQQSNLADIADITRKSKKEESPIILVISKFQHAPIFKLNLKLQKGAFYIVLGTWQIAKME